MCQSNAYITNQNSESLIMEDVAKIEILSKDQIRLVSLFGDEKEVKGVIDEINLLSHKIIISAL